MVSALMSTDTGKLRYMYGFKPGHYVVRDLNLTVPHSTQVYKKVWANLILGVTLKWTSIPFRRGRNQDNGRLDGPLGLYFTWNTRYDGNQGL